MPQESLNFWSSQRSRLLRHCHCSYLAHYLLSEGGFDHAAEEQKRAFYQAKNIVPDQEFLFILLQQAVFNSLYQNVLPAERTDFLRERVRKIFYQRRIGAIKQWLKLSDDGSKNYIPRGLTASDCNIDEFFFKLQEQLTRLCDKLVESSLWAAVEKLKFENLLKFTLPLSFDFLTTRIFLNPLLGFEEDGEIKFVEFDRSVASEDPDSELIYQQYRSCLYKLYVHLKYKRKPDQVKSLFWNVKDDALRVFPEESHNLSQIIMIIQDESARMSALAYNYRHNPHLSYFKKEPVNCSMCKFEELCSKQEADPEE